MKRAGIIFSVVLCLLLCRQGLTRAGQLPAENYEQEGMSDPLEGFNRAMFKFNDKVYVYALKPAGKGLSKVLPRCVRQAIGSLFDTVGAPKRALFCLLQAKPKRAGKEVLKIPCNIADAATLEKWQLANKLAIKDDEDGDQVLAVWQIPSGPYLVLPLLGPLSARGVVGAIGDGAGHPAVYLLTIYEAIGARVTEVINDESINPSQYDFFVEKMLDPYIAVREAYNDNRKKRSKE